MIGHSVDETIDVHSGIESPPERKRILRPTGEISVARRVLQQRLQEIIASSEIHEFSAHARDTSSIL